MILADTVFFYALLDRDADASLALLAAPCFVDPSRPYRSSNRTMSSSPR
jgi:hypothetical protein